MRRRSEDLPAFGSPASAASATSFSRRSSAQLSPGRPVSAKRGACRVGVANRALPRPPHPPRRDDDAQAGCARSATSAPSSVAHLRPDRDARGRHRRRPRRACCAPPPFPPRLAAKSGRPRSDERSRSDGSATRTTSPPRPPSPPSGPPFGTYFSRRKASAAVSAPAGADDDAGTVVEHEAGRRPAREPRASPPVR